jgi:hypothetical protein
MLSHRRERRCRATRFRSRQEQAQAAPLMLCAGAAALHGLEDEFLAERDVGRRSASRQVEMGRAGLAAAGLAAHLLHSARRLPAAPLRFSSSRCNEVESAVAAAADPPACRFQSGLALPLASHILLNERLLRATSWSLLKLLPPSTIGYGSHSWTWFHVAELHPAALSTPSTWRPRFCSCSASGFLPRPLCRCRCSAELLSCSILSEVASCRTSFRVSVGSTGRNSRARYGTRSVVDSRYVLISSPSRPRYGNQSCQVLPHHLALS